ncbi:hypothetical protein SLEP1_g42667 [Rubroshorea leprosula]|uniref:Glycosyltransferase n=1 Tax=Rubroshorea leprosula TaxID=152421 RepID=A0AAV5LAN5_9ROSI|nr:hypothetical protein SLEP1_g42667 [Rubroshorea leprosula]
MEISRPKSIRTILIFPWLAHGHISPFRQLAKKLSKRNIFIYFCSTPVNLSSVKPMVSLKESLCIQLVEFHLPSLPDLPSHYHTTKGLLPHLMNTLKNAFDMASHRFSEILKTLKPDLVIYDFLQPWAPKLASLQGIPAVVFLCFSAVMTSFTLHAIKNDAGGTYEHVNDLFPYPEIYLHDYERQKFVNLIENDVNGVKDKDRAHQCFEGSSEIILIKSFREIEGKFMDYLCGLLNKRMIPVGPLVRVPMEEHEKAERLMKWLEKKKPSSTVFVSFGTEYFLSPEEREEMAYGIELSMVNFIWVLRFPVGEKTNIEKELPRGFLERTGERGMVVEGWAPQVKILLNRSIAGFVSHCGWSSVMESISVVVPIIAMPMHLDQPLNARLVENIGIGIEVRRNKKGCLERKDIAKATKEVVVVEGSGGNIRRKVKEMSEIVKKKGEEEIDGVVDELVKLCGIKKTANP